ncbi:MAG: carboxypeptidase regulatory-like domain-containing protein, partial [Opitutaceae bacterium]
MTSPLLRLLTIVFALAAALFPAHAAAQSEGNVTGLVVNAATGNALSNAVVSVSGTDRSAVTDLEGRFTLLRVPVGPRTLQVSYPGLNSGNVAITVAPGLNPAPPIALTSEVYRLD